MIAYDEIVLVAKAIFYADNKFSKDWDAIDQGVRNYYLYLAKAATSAMRAASVDRNRR